jgi:FKBP-type peptidyl-prolyl cis-trans isomerase
MKNALIFCLALLLNTTLFAQSKKELEAQVNTLKKEIEQLKKPNEFTLTSEQEKASYGLGILMAGNLKRQGGDSILVDFLKEGFSDVYLNKTLKISEQEASMIVQQYMQLAMERKIKKAKEAGEVFLNTNKTKEGVKVTASGLQYKVLSTSTGKKPQPSDKVTVHYTGKLIDGTEFDSSVRKGTPLTMGANEFIRGFSEALMMMSEGDKWILYIPYDIAYGERGSGQIPPYSALIFELELIKVN